jgi:Mn2+/Fe2+ NRAMP family transporter
MCIFRTILYVLYSILLIVLITIFINGQYQIKAIIGSCATLGLIPFFADKVWAYFTSKKQNMIAFEKLTEQAIRELDFNMMPGVGNKESQFQLEALEELLSQTQDKDLKNEIDYIIRHARLCNSYGGIRNLQVVPGQIKSLCHELKDKLLAKQ